MHFIQYVKPGKLAGMFRAFYPFVFISLLTTAIPGAFAQGNKIDFDIEQKPLAAAMKEFAEQANLQIMFAADVFDPSKRVSLKGSYSPPEALAILLADTGLEYVYDGTGSVAVRLAGSKEVTEPMATPLLRTELVSSKTEPIQVAQAETAAKQSQTDRGERKTEAGRSTIEEVVVTARKREERLQDVPISVSAFSAADLESKSLTSLKELGQFTPNFTFGNHSQFGRTGAIVYMRGVGQPDANVQNDPGVGVYLDGVYMGRMQGLDFDLVDLERVEVLRGPQGTLFGKNTIGGAVNMVTARPTDEFSGTAQVTTGSFDRIDGSLSVNVPIIPGSLAAKFAVATRNREGYGTRFDFSSGEKTGEMAGIERLTGRAIFNWTPSENLDILFSMDGARHREDGPIHQLATANNQPPLIALLNNFVDPDYDTALLTDSKFTSYANGRNAAELDSWGVALTADWDLGSWAIKSITSYRGLEALNGVDPDGSPYRIIDSRQAHEQEQFAQELQFSGLSFDDRLNWTLGFYYFEEEAFNIREAEVVKELLDAIGLDLSVTSNIWSDVNSYAVYGQGTYNLSDKLSMTAGLRYTLDEKEITRNRFRPISGKVDAPLGTLEDDWDAFSGRIGLEYAWNEDVMTYISAARGFKSGGINGASTTSFDFLPFDPEFIWTYELGLRSEFFDKRLRFNASLFYSDYTDMQFTVFGADPVTGTSIQFISNAAESEIKGFETDIVINPAQGLTMTMGLGFIDPEYTRVDPGATITKDNKFVQTPKWTVTASGEYVVPLDKWGSVIGKLDYAYKTEIYYDVNNSPFALQDDYGILNARLTFEAASRNWTISLFGTNLTDTEYMLGAIDFANALGFADQQYARPREWGLEFSYTF